MLRAALAALVTAGTAMTVPKNHQLLIRRLEETWLEVLIIIIIKNCQISIKNKLRRIVYADGGYIERIRTAANANEDDLDQNNNVNT